MKFPEAKSGLSGFPIRNSKRMTSTVGIGLRPKMAGCDLIFAREKIDYGLENFRVVNCVSS
jgi:hypothetical protein